MTDIERVLSELDIEEDPIPVPAPPPVPDPVPAPVPVPDPVPVPPPATSPLPPLTAEQKMLFAAWLNVAVTLRGPTPVLTVAFTTGRKLTSAQRAAYLKFLAFQLAATPVTG